MTRIWGGIDTLIGRSVSIGAKPATLLRMNEYGDTAVPRIFVFVGTYTEIVGWAKRSVAHRWALA
jgi:hypothetical protein